MSDLSYTCELPDRRPFNDVVVFCDDGLYLSNVKFTDCVFENILYRVNGSVVWEDVTFEQEDVDSSTITVQIEGLAVDDTVRFSNVKKTGTQPLEFVVNLDATAYGDTTDCGSGNPLVVFEDFSMDLGDLFVWADSTHPCITTVVLIDGVSVLDGSLFVNVSGDYTSSTSLTGVELRCYDAFPMIALDARFTAESATAVQISGDNCGARKVPFPCLSLPYPSLTLLSTALYCV
jgi:hypothetical protein